MRIESSNVTFFQCLALYLACSVVLLIAYTGQIGEANAYMGMQPWDMSVAGYIGFLIGLPIVAWIVSRAKERPSDFFRVFYGTIVVTSFLALHPVTGAFSVTEIFTGILLLFLPFLMIEILDTVLPAIKIRGMVGSAWIELVLVLALLLVVASAATRSPASAGFGLDVSHHRRLEGRDIYAAGSLLAYGLSMAMNGMAPYLAFRAGLRSSVLLFGVSLVAVTFFYWLLGAKGPFVIVIVAALLGFFVRKGSLSHIASFFLAAILGLGLVMLVEWLFFDGYSLIADYFFRRVFAVQAQIQGYYLKFLVNEKMVSWSWLYGSFDRNFAATFHIGEHFMGNEESNANTDAFLYQFAAKGLIGYIGATILVPFILVIFDRLYRSSRNPSYLFLGFLYGLLVIEQAYTVALVSSGVVILFALTLLEAEFDAGKSPAT